MAFLKGTALIGTLFLSSCQSYHYANKVKLMSFSENMSKGEPVGVVSGKDCAWNILGVQLGYPTLNRAFLAAQSGHNTESIVSSFEDREAISKMAYRYLNDVRTDNEGFDAVVVAKNCITVKGKAYK